MSITLPLFDRAPVGEAPPPRTLRKYQSEAIVALRKLVALGKKRILAVGPTAMGKMVIIASIGKSSSVPILFVVHRRELIDGCIRELAKLGITRVGVLRGDDDREDPSAPIQLASIQTLARRKKPVAGLVIIDEAHRSVSESYRDHVFTAYPDAIILGFTATPGRLDGKPLGEFYEEMLLIATYGDLIKAGYISEPQYWAAPIQPDLHGINVVHGDFEETKLGDVMRQAHLTGQIVDHWLKHGRGLRTIVFAVNIAHSLAIEERFAAAGIRISHLDGETKDADRDEILRALGAGELDVVTNCNVLLEGVDVPSVKCIVWARPTLSLVVARQSAGRELRPWPCDAIGKVTDASVRPILLDHAGNIDRLGSFPTDDLTWSLHTKPSGSTVARLKLCKTCFAYVDAGRYVCPHCGTDFPPPTPKEVPKEDGASLVLRSSGDAQRSFYDDHVLKAKMRGFKPGWPSAKYKEKFGAWPPRAWGEATKSTFASDPQWQAALEHREKERAFWNERGAEKGGSDGAHTCHARGCDVHVKPEMLMCAKHWSLVTPDLQRAVWSTYRAGQCDDKKPSRAWLDAAKAAIECVAACYAPERLTDAASDLRSSDAKADGGGHEAKNDLDDRSRPKVEGAPVADHAQVRAGDARASGDGCDRAVAALTEQAPVDVVIREPATRRSESSATRDDGEEDFLAWLESEGIQ